MFINEHTMVCQGNSELLAGLRSNSLDQECLNRPLAVSPACPVISPPPFPSGPGSSILIDEAGTESTEGGQYRVTIDILPNDVLLEIFDCYVQVSWKVEAWHTLVHVCRNWRNVVFGSPRRLNLRLFCTAKTPVRERLTVWPLFPIVVQSYNHSTSGAENIVAVLEHNERICRIELLQVPSSLLAKFLEAMHVPFPSLTFLRFQLIDKTGLVVSDSFSGGSAPRLRELSLTRIPFPGLPKLFSSATHIAYLYLWKIPHPGYFSPDTMATCLSSLTSLENLILDFESPLSHTVRESRHSPPHPRIDLPSLKYFEFKGVCAYLEDLVARIQASLLNSLGITFFHQLIFDTPQLVQFISRTPNFKTPNKARVVLSSLGVSIALPWTFDRNLGLGISCRRTDWQLSCLAQICSSSFPQTLIPMVEHLYILEDKSQRPLWQDDIENIQWLELLHPLTAVKNLYLSEEIAPHITPTLQELVGERVTEVLPALECLYLEGIQPSGVVLEGIREFVGARQLFGYPIAVSLWDGKQEEQ